MFAWLHDWYICRKLFKTTQVQASTAHNEITTTKELLHSNALHVATIQTTFTDSDGSVYTVTVPRAAETDMWPMGTHFWVRDAAIGADRVLQSAAITNDPILLAEGKELLLSVLTIMSTQQQLQTFTTAIAVHTFEHGLQAKHWPQIFLDIQTNLSGTTYEPWAHKQDAWQMLAVFTFRALQRGQITVSELTEAHRTFLALSAPFLVAVEYWRQPNSGSWEELEAVRSSVLSFDTTLLYEYMQYLEHYDAQWLTLQRNDWWKLVQSKTGAKNYQQYLQTAYQKGLEVLQKQLPFESPQYEKTDARYREADAALFYVLDNNSIELIAREFDNSNEWVAQTEQAVLVQIFSLQDERTGAIARYKKDSYQRLGFFRPSIVQKLRKYYGSQSGEASGIEDFAKRGELVPKGPEAMWTHFVWQLCGWSFKKYQTTNNKKYNAIFMQQLPKAFKLITTPNNYTLTVDSNGKVRVATVPPYVFPECYLTEEYNGKQFTFASPHTPLNWATREAQLVCYLLEGK